MGKVWDVQRVVLGFQALLERALKVLQPIRGQTLLSCNKPGTAPIACTPPYPRPCPASISLSLPIYPAPVPISISPRRAPHPYSAPASSSPPRVSMYAQIFTPAPPPHPCTHPYPCPRLSCPRRASIYAHIRKLLSHSDAGVRARVCNLIGNMCRHSHYFYSALDRHGLIPPLIQRCSDPVGGVSSLHAVGASSSLHPNAVALVPRLECVVQRRSLATAHRPQRPDCCSCPYHSRLYRRSTACQ